MATPPKRRWFAFRLRPLLILFVVAGCVLMPLTVKLHEARQRRKAVEWVWENGGSVQYAIRGTHYLQQIPPGPKWIRRWVGNDDYFRKIHEVHLRGDRVSHVQPLSRMPSLRKLVLHETDVHDLSPLSNLKELEYLILNEAPFRDLSPVRNMSNLRELYIHLAPVTDLSALDGLTKLEKLTLNKTNVTDAEIRRLQKALPNCHIWRDGKRNAAK